MKRLALFVMVVLGAFSASAQERRERPLVILKSVTPDSPSLEASLGEMVRRLGLQLVQTQPSDGEVPLAIVEIDLTSGSVLVDSPARKLTIRRTLAVELEGDVRRETAASLVASAIDVLLHTEPPRIPLKNEEPVVTTVAPEPVRTKTGAVGLDLGIGVGARLAGGSSVLDFGASVHALTTFALGSQLPGLMLWLGAQPALDLQGDTLAFRGQLFSARLFVQLELFRWQYGRLEAGAGAGADLFSFAAFQREGELLRPMPMRRIMASPIVSGLLTYRFPVGESVHVFTSLTVDGDLYAARAPPARPMNERNDPQPWTVRPMLQVGVSFAPLRARE